MITPTISNLNLSNSWPLTQMHTRYHHLSVLLTSQIQRVQNRTHSLPLQKLFFLLLLNGNIVIHPVSFLFKIALHHLRMRFKLLGTVYTSTEKCLSCLIHSYISNVVFHYCFDVQLLHSISQQLLSSCIFFNTPCFYHAFLLASQYTWNSPVHLVNVSPIIF